MRTHFLILSIAVLGATLPDRATAQVLGPPDSLVLAALARLQPGKGIRVHTAGLGRLEGKFASLTDTTVALGTTTGPSRVAVAGIDSLWQRGSWAGKGALAGALVGGVVGAALGGAGCDDACGPTYVITSGAGALAGLVAGVLIGSAIPKWHRRVP